MIKHEEFADAIADMLMQFLEDFKTGIAPAHDDKTGFPVGHGVEDVITSIHYEEGEQEFTIQTANGEVWLIRPFRLYRKGM